MMMGRHVASVCLLLTVVTSAYAALTKPAGCGSEVGCYSDCEGGSCSFVVTWNSNEQNVDFTLRLDTSSLPGDRYFALGLSSDDKMGDDSVTSCIKSGNSVEVFKYYNEMDPRTSTIIDQPMSGLSNTKKSSVNGVLSCSYSQTKVSDHDKVFSLGSTRTLFVAVGRIPGGVLMEQHDKLPFISPKKIDFEKNEDVSGVAKNHSVKAHGCLMLFAWMFFASLGIFMARFYKKVWPNSKCCSEKVWFTIHRVCMVSALLLCVTGFIVIFVEVQEWSELTGHTSWQRAHPYLGCIVTFLAVVNPVMALLRPHPEDKNRYIFNWAHWFVGTSAHILAALTLILGVTLDKASVPYDAVWIIVAWLGYQIIVVLLMELFDCIVIDPKDRYSSDNDLKEPKGSGLKKVAFAFHLLIITGFTLATVIVVAIN